MWKQSRSESCGFRGTEVTKGFHPGSVFAEVGGGGLLIVLVGAEKKGLLTGLPFQGRQPGYTTQTPGEKGM